MRVRNSERADKILALSLYSGSGGLDIGLSNTGAIEIVGCVEWDSDACETLRLSVDKGVTTVIEADISELDVPDVLESIGRSSEEIDLIVGGPPCQAFSVFGKRRGLDDPRGNVILDFVRFVEEIHPKAFVMENVRGLLSMKHEGEKGGIYHLLIDAFNRLGYRVDVFVVNSVNYGAPQIRERVIFIGNRLQLVADFPEPTHSDKPMGDQQRFATLGDAIKGKKFRDQGIMDFSPRKKGYLEMIPEGGNWRSMPEEIQKESMGKSWFLKGGRSAYWRRLSWQYPCPTVTTFPNHAGTSMCHPDETRALSVSEMAHIQGFPEDWQFCGSHTSKCKQIGNAVPVILGEKVGETIIRMFSDSIITKSDNNALHTSPHREIHIRPHVRTRQYFKNGKVFNSSPYLNNQNVKQEVRVE